MPKQKNTFCQVLFCTSKSQTYFFVIQLRKISKQSCNKTATTEHDKNTSSPKPNIVLQILSNKPSFVNKFLHVHLVPFAGKTA